MRDARAQEEDVESRFQKLKTGASNLSISLQSHFWAFLSNQARFLINQKSDVFYDVMTGSSPNPLGSQQSVDAAGGVGVAMRSIRLLLLPIQKALQYYAWYGANKDYEEKYERKIAELERMQAEIKNGIWYADDIEKAALKLDAINANLEALKKENETRNRDNVAGVKKPTFTWQDGMYLALDIILLGLAIAALVYGASIPGAAIAVTAASISGVVAGVHFGKFVYAGYQLKKEDERLASVLDKINKNEVLNDNDHQFIAAQKEKAKIENPQMNIAEKSDAEILAIRKGEVKKSLKQNITDRYQAMRKTMGLGLTVLSIVSASLVLVGLMMGPAGVPVIAAGVGLGLVTTGIAVGMMIVNVVKKNRDLKLERESTRPVFEAEAVDVKNDMSVVPTNRVVNDRLYRETNEHQEEKVRQKDQRDDAGKLVNPFVESVEAPKRSFFDRLKKREVSNDVEMKDLSSTERPKPK